MTRAFTLMELLVVVTIITVLMALLAPAMDRAVYRAELAMCGSHLRAISSAMTTYAMGANRQYPYSGNSWMCHPPRKDSATLRTLIGQQTSTTASWRYWKDCSRKRA